MKKNKNRTKSEKQILTALNATKNEEIIALREIKKKSKSQKKRLRVLETAELEKWITRNVMASTVGKAASADHGQTAVSKNGENSNQAGNPSKNPIKKSKGQKRRERLERERLDWERQATINDQPTLSPVAQSSSSQAGVNVVEKFTNHDKNEKKRKRTTSNASTHSYPGPANSNLVDGVDRLASPAPSKEKHKKGKKSKHEEETQETLLVIDAQETHRDAVNKIKHSQGKTESKKKRKKHAGKAEHNSKSQSDVSTRVEDHELPAVSKKREVDVQSEAQEDITSVDAQPKRKKQKVKHDKADQANFTRESQRKEEALLETIRRASLNLKNAPGDHGPSDVEADDESDSQILDSDSEHTKSSNHSEHGSSSLVTPSKTRSHIVFESPVRPPPTFAQRRGTSVVNTPSNNPRTKTIITDSPQVTTSADLVNAVSFLKKSVSHLNDAFTTLLSPNAMEWTPTATNYTPLDSAAKTSGSKNKKKSKAVQTDKSPQYVLIESLDEESSPREPTWEDKSGKFRAKIADLDGKMVKETIAFSSSYIAKKEIITFSNTSFRSFSLAAEESVAFETEMDGGIQPEIEVCFVIRGRVGVVLWRGEEDEDEEKEGDGEGEEGKGRCVFEIEKGGVWRVKSGERCVVSAVDYGKGKQRVGEKICEVGVWGVR